MRTITRRELRNASAGVLGNADTHGLQTEAAVAFLMERGAEVHVERLEAGHDLTPDDGVAVAGWLRARDAEGA